MHGVLPKKKCLLWNLKTNFNNLTVKPLQQATDGTTDVHVRDSNFWIPLKIVKYLYNNK